LKVPPRRNVTIDGSNQPGEQANHPGPNDNNLSVEIEDSDPQSINQRCGVIFLKGAQHS
jgi:hypothetical protein